MEHVLGSKIGPRTAAGEISGVSVRGCEQRASFLSKSAFLHLTLPNFKQHLLPGRWPELFIVLPLEIDVTRPLDHTGELALPSEPNSAAPLPACVR
jgi:hypothetical protein